MPASSSRSGYTLVELLIASALSALILAGAGGALVAGMKLVDTLMAESEFALNSRLLRDKLLFHVLPDTTTTHFGGLWSMTNTASMIEGGAKIRARGGAIGTSLNVESGPDVQVLLSDAGFYTEGTGGRNTHWLRPAGLANALSFDEAVRVTEEGTDRFGRNYARRFRVDVEYRHHPPYLPESVTGYDLVRRESFVVPVMGKVHRRAFLYNGSTSGL